MLDQLGQGQETMTYHVYGLMARPETRHGSKHHKNIERP